ncbi:uncharacterized protein LOC129779052 [Toxorhynchites rutilus septentrionalis]|uniref:uncharacterized protein LOC129779052 n=1 Tax=Toxorhynchites rutilus septentrionalis TaxID=329112 RepID=UPI002478C454|nr:uncharacterized protein LOC129779052 [Toxorhynchites rutilus septentrionalis]XP_055642283.1 uncharacterized protein LOC129779052 [Toxorhynchites rutilus septentrionalis]
MKPSPKKSLSSKLKQRSKTSSSGGTNANSGTASAPQSNNIGNNTAGLPQVQHPNHYSHLMRAATAGGSDTNSSGNDANCPAPKDKSTYKSYAGFSSRSIRTIWEQHDKQETEVAAEVYSKLAEDTTYKLWELANSIKTYSRHANGKVTYDLVNDILKDCDVPPIVGANSEPWDKIEYDGVYFFNSDEVLDLREEYIKDVTMEQSNIPVLTTSWMAESSIAEDLIELYNNVCDAIYLGDEECFEQAIEILTFNPHVPSLMKLLLTKAIEMLGFEYTETTLIRSLQFLEALVKNYHVSHSDLTLELSLLSQIFVNLLLGPIHLVHAKFIPAQPANLDLQPQSQTSLNQQPHSINQNGTESSLGSGTHSQNNADQLQPGYTHSTMVPMNILDNNLTGPSEDSNNSNSNATEELLRSIENIKEGPDEIDINNIKDEYEALFSMVQGLGKQETVGEDGNLSAGDGFQIKAEFNSDFDPSAQNFLVQQGGGMMAEAGMSFEIKTENEIELKQDPVMLEDPDENFSAQMSESSNGEVINPNSTTLENENITTLICSSYLVDDVSRVVGLCSGKWGFVEQECTFLLVERLQRYFNDSKSEDIDYVWLSRLLRGLWSVGEFAFREMCPYFEYIEPRNVPEFVNYHLNCAAIFLRGKSDVHFYEYLNEVCGDGLLPFMFKYEQYIETRHQKFNRLGQKANKGKHCYKIHSKVLLKVHPKTSQKPPLAVDEVFPDRTEKQLDGIVAQSQQNPTPRFSFRFAGCRPVNLKANRNRLTGSTRLTSFCGTVQDKHDSGVRSSITQDENALRSYHTKVVIARRKLLKADTNQHQRRQVYCYGSTLL